MQLFQGEFRIIFQPINCNNTTISQYKNKMKATKYERIQFLMLYYLEFLMYKVIKREEGNFTWKKPLYITLQKRIMETYHREVI